MTLVESIFSLDPFSDALFVFCNKKRQAQNFGMGRRWFLALFLKDWNAVDSNGTEGENSTMLLDGKELTCLIDEARLEKKLKGKKFSSVGFCKNIL